MELEHFIEQDIRTFLDNMRTKELAPTADTPRRTGVLSPEELAIYSPSRDYSKELHTALREENFQKAKHILDELRESYAGYPEDAPERIEGNRLLESLYATFQKRVDDHESMSAAMHQPITNQTMQHSDEIPSPPETKIASEDELRALFSEIAHIETLAKEHQYTSAISLYQDLKVRVSHEQFSQEQKNKLVPKLSEMYRLLHDMIESSKQVMNADGLDDQERKLVGAP